MPAVAGQLYVVGTTLVYNAAVPADAVSVAGSDAALTISDIAGTIQSSVPGFVSSGGTVTGAVPSYIRAIAVNVHGSGATLAINSPLTTARDLLLTAPTVIGTAAVTARNVTETGTTLIVGADVRTTGAAPFGGDAVFHGAVVVTGTGPTLATHAVHDGNVVFDGPVSGTARLIVNAGTAGNITASGTIALGGAAGLTLTGSNLSLQQVTDSGTTTLTAQNAVTLGGNLTSTGAITIAANQDGSGPEGFTQTAGSLNTTFGGGLLNPGVNLVVNTPTGGSGSAIVRGINVGFNGVAFINTKGTTSGPVPNDTVGGAIVGADGTQGASATNVVGGTLNLTAGPGGIDLNTAVTKVNPVVASGALAGDITLRSRGVPVVVSGMQTTAGNIMLTSDQGMTVSGTSAGDLTFTTTGGDVALNTVQSTSPTGTLTINAAGAIAPSVVGEVDVAHLRLTAATGIGSAVIPLSLGTGPYSGITLAANTGTGGIAVTSAAPLSVGQATAGAGDINLGTFPTGDLTVAGNVRTASGGAVTLSAGGSALLTGGTVASDTGPVVLAPSANLMLAVPAVVTTGDTAPGAITVQAPLQSTLLGIAGTLAATGGIAINGAGAALGTTLNLTGSLRAGGALAIAVAGTGTTTVALAGTLSSGGDTTVAFTGPTTLTVPGTMFSGGSLTIGGAANASATTLELTGLLGAARNIVVGGATTAGSTRLDNEGSVASTGGTVTLRGGTTGAFVLSNSGRLAGTAVVLQGSTGTGQNTLLIGGQVAATGPSGITIAGGAAADAVTVSAALSAPAGGTTFSGPGNYAYNVAPSAASALTFAGTGTGTLAIDTALANIAAATPNFSAPITFVGGVFQPWTRTAGTWTVTPTVP